MVLSSSDKSSHIHTVLREHLKMQNLGEKIIKKSTILLDDRYKQPDHQMNIFHRLISMSIYSQFSIILQQAEGNDYDPSSLHQYYLQLGRALYYLENDKIFDQLYPAYLTSFHAFVSKHPRFLADYYRYSRPDRTDILRDRIHIILNKLPRDVLNTAIKLDTINNIPRYLRLVCMCLHFLSPTYRFDFTAMKVDPTTLEDANIYQLIGTLQFAATRLRHASSHHTEDELDLVWPGWFEKLFA